MHWIRHTTLTWVERNFGYAVARAYAGHTDSGGQAGATSTYVRASLAEVAAALSQPERQVLLAHERAHASSLHYLFTTVARLAAAANPLLRPVAAAVGYTVERWADERAAAAGDRQLAARAIAHAALAAAAAPPRRPAAAAAVPGAVSIPARMRPAGPVPRRVAALLRPPPQPQLLLLAAAVALVAVAGVSALEAARDLHALLDAARTAGKA
jgi:beta-lactamase regulating signal transducer with metallopeptidase domain